MLTYLFRLSLASLGSFPHPRSPLWVGPLESHSIIQLCCRTVGQIECCDFSHFDEVAPASSGLGVAAIGDGVEYSRLNSHSADIPQSTNVMWVFEADFLILWDWRSIMSLLLHLHSWRYWGHHRELFCDSIVIVPLGFLSTNKTPWLMHVAIQVSSRNLLTAFVTRYISTWYISLSTQASDIMSTLRAYCHVASRWVMELCTSKACCSSHYFAQSAISTTSDERLKLRVW